MNLRALLPLACVLVAAIGACSTMSARPGSLDDQVRILIDRIEFAEDGKDQAAAFVALEKLGKPAAPYIIKRMDNRAQLKVPRIVLENPPTTFETHRIYGPKEVVDALAAILNKLTGENFGFIYNGGNDPSRAGAVAGWRAWCRSAYPDVRDGCVP